MTNEIKAIIDAVAAAKKKFDTAAAIEFLKLRNTKFGDEVFNAEEFHRVMDALADYAIDKIEATYEATEKLTPFVSNAAFGLTLVIVPTGGLAHASYLISCDK